MTNDSALGSQTAELEIPESVLAHTMERVYQNQVRMLKELHQVKTEAGEQTTTLELEIKDFLQGLLTVLDSFDQTADKIETALKPDDKKAKRILGNFKLIRKKIQRELEKFQLKAIPAEGEMVAGLHKALEADPDSELPEGQVISVERVGYFWRNQILRPTEVIISGAEPE